MNFYNEKIELENIRERGIKMTDDLLDLYKKHPKECKDLLLQIEEINNELCDLEKDFDKLEKIINDEVY
jgi:hypothetical protein